MLDRAIQLMVDLPPGPIRYKIGEDYVNIYTRPQDAFDELITLDLFENRHIAYGQLSDGTFVANIQA